MLIKNNGTEFSAIGFGEVMMRLSPPGDERILSSSQFVKHPGGSELNVVSGMARLGLRTGLISKLPQSSIGEYIRSEIRSYMVSDDYILKDKDKESRLGLYYYEGGSYPRKPQVTYDRTESSIHSIKVSELPEELFSKSSLFHTSGISLALGGSVKQTAVDLIKKFRENGALISFDVNYRASLWSEEEARIVCTELLPLIDILFVSEETCRRMFQKTGTLESMMKEFCTEYGISVVASTQRIINNPHSHTFGSILYSSDDDKYYSEKPYENIEVTDRIGSGDAYVSGVLYALLSGKTCQDAVSFGNAMAAVKNTVPGDMITAELTEIQGVINDHYSLKPVSEMNR